MVYDLIALDLGEIAIARVYTDGEIEILYKETSEVPNKHNKGGQSKERYQRSRENEITQWYKKINLKLKTFDCEFYIGMSKVYYKRFFNTLNTYNQKKIKERINCETAGISGIYDLVNRLERSKLKQPLTNPALIK